MTGVVIYKGMNIEEEKRLVETMQSDAESFGKLFDAYYPQIFGYIQRRTADISITQEITSDVFCKALENIEHFEWRGIPFSSWLYRIAAHEIANFYRRDFRKKKHFIRLSNNDEDYSITLNTELINAQDEIRKYEGYLDIHQSISLLPLKYQEAITLRFFEGMQFKEMAAILGKPESSVKTLVHRGLERLKKILINAEPLEKGVGVKRR